MNIKKVIIGSDHGGFALKEDLKRFLSGEGYEVVDFGCYSKEPVDYPDIAFLVADAVASNPGFVGVMLDGAGVASCIVCNKIPGIRASLCWDAFTARIAREHDDANVLCLGERVIGIELAREVVRAFLGARFTGEDRHRRRLEKLLAVERAYLRHS